MLKRYYYTIAALLFILTSAISHAADFYQRMVIPPGSYIVGGGPGGGNSSSGASGGGNSSSGGSGVGGSSLRSEGGSSAARSNSETSIPVYCLDEFVHQAPPGFPLPLAPTDLGKATVTVGDDKPVPFSEALGVLVALEGTGSFSEIRLKSLVKDKRVTQCGRAYRRYSRADGEWGCRGLRLSTK